MRRKTDFFTGMTKVFPYTVLIHTYFFPKILIFMVIYTDFVSDHTGRSGSHTKSSSGGLC